MRKTKSKPENAPQEKSGGDCSLSFSSEMPTREGCYWMKCGENDGEFEWASVFRRADGVMMCELDSLGCYGLNAIHENLCDVQWASAATQMPENKQGACRRRMTRLVRFPNHDRLNSTMKTKTITLSLEDWETIVDAIQMTQDEGPEGEGWKSDELSRAESAMNHALDAAPICESNA